MSLEYLGTSRPPRRRRALGLAVLVLVLVSLGGVWWTEHLRQEATVRIVDAEQQARDRAEAGEARVLSTLAYASPMIWSTSVPEGVRAGLRALVEKQAAEVAAALTGIGDDVASTTVLPWQEAQQQDRQRVLDLVVAERSRFDRIAEDARAIATVFSEPAPA